MSETQWNFPRFAREGLDNKEEDDEPIADNIREDEDMEDNITPTVQSGGSRNYVRGFNSSEYDTGEPTSKYDDELIITGQMPIKDNAETGPPTEVPIPPKTDEENNETDPYTLWTNGASISVILKAAGRSPLLILQKLARVIAMAITRLYYKDMNTNEATQTSGELETQILRVFLYFISLFMALNIWYCWIHTTYTFEFVSLLSYAVVKPFYLILQPILMAADCVTYILHNAFREQNETMDIIKGILRDYRTFALVILTICMGGIMSAINAMAKASGSKSAKGVKSNIANNASPFAALTILMFLMASAQNEFYARFNIFGIILLLLVFVIMLAMVPFMEVGFILYFTIFLNWFLIIHGTMRYGSPWSAIKNIFEDLHDAPIVGDDPSNIIYRVKAFFVQHIYDIFVKSSLISIFSVGINESRKNLRNRDLANAMTATYVGGIALCVIPLILSFQRAFSEQTP